MGRQTVSTKQVCEEIFTLKAISFSQKIYIRKIIWLLLVYNYKSRSSPEDGFVSSGIEDQEAYTGHDSGEPEEKQRDSCKPVESLVRAG